MGCAFGSFDDTPPYLPNSQNLQTCILSALGYTASNPIIFCKPIKTTKCFSRVAQNTHMTDGRHLENRTRAQQLLKWATVWPQWIWAEKCGDAVSPFLGRGELGPHLTQSRLGRGLPPYQVASWFIQLFGHNRRGPKIGGCASFSLGSWVPI